MQTYCCSFAMPSRSLANFLAASTFLRIFERALNCYDGIDTIYLSQIQLLSLFCSRQGTRSHDEVITYVAALWSYRAFISLYVPCLSSEGKAH